MMFRRGEGHVGFVVISKQGRDSGEYYVIVPAAGNVHEKGSNYVWVANGLKRTIEKPKHKNLAHLQITNTQVPNIDKLLSGERVSSNLKLVGFLKQFRSTK